MKVTIQLSVNLLWILQFVPYSGGDCPQSNGYIHRIGTSRFYIFHRLERGSYSTWEEAFQLCEIAGMRLARVDKLTSFFMIAHPLRKIVHEYGLKDTWYWVAAKFNYSIQQYTWRPSRTTEGDPLKYVNFVYRKPRPVGVGTHLNYRNRLVDEHVDQCLAFSFPYYGIKEANGITGYAPSFDERACVSSQARHVMCESVDPTCKQGDPGPYVLSEGKEQYFDDGNWIIGNRKYIINWRQRNKEQARQHCESLGLNLYNPTLEDICLIPFIKMWGRNITVSKFWTSWTYEKDTRNFKNAEGDLVIKNSARMGEYHDIHEHESRKRRSVYASENHHCVALAHWFEFPSQMPCDTKDVGLCHWHFMDFVPANCLNSHGTICEHEDSAERTCEWKEREWRKNMTTALVRTATLPFGFPGNTLYRRSTYKQTFGSMYCRPGYSMVRERNKKWERPPPSSINQTFLYDYKETFWVVDTDGFKKPPGSLCTVSAYRKTTDSRFLKSVPCTQWHFYLCKKRLKPPRQQQHPNSNFKLPAYKWGDRSTPRL